MTDFSLNDIKHKINGLKNQVQILICLFFLFYNLFTA